MKEVFELYAFYNRKADEVMMDILKKLSEDMLKKDMKTYHKSILETFMHMMFSNTMWLRRTNSLLEEKYESIKNSDILKMSDDVIKDGIDKDYKYAFKIKSGLDDIFVRYTAELDEKDFNIRLRYRTLKGQELERTYWHTIMHIFNHETHSRGMISAMLDQLGVENDYSGVSLYVE